ncbi:MAG TPA: serine hydrolase [Thermoanaerobaculia bacterium]|nr:serine hydrolase [Thermoanaerobaculia bacterium]
MKTTIALLTLLLAVPAVAFDDLRPRIEKIVADTDATVGVSALHVESGRRFSLRGDESFPLGSVYKLPVAVAFLRQVDQGKYSLGQEVTITPDQFATGYSPLRDRAAGKPVTITLQRALEAMLAESDNTAGNLIERLAGNVDEPGTDTPDGMVAFLERFYRRQDGLSDRSHDLAMRILSRTPAGERRIRAGAPRSARVAHKTGTLRGALNDAGIVISPNGKDHLLIAVFTKGGREATTTQRERTISTITREIYRSFVEGRTGSRF